MIRTVTITLQVESDEHGADIERAIDSWLDLDDLDGTGLGAGVTFLGCTIDVSEASLTCVRWPGSGDRDPLPGDVKHPEGLLRDEPQADED